MRILVLPLCAVLAVLLAPTVPARAERFETLSIQLPSEVVERFRVNIQAQLRRDLGMELVRHGNALVGRFWNQRNVVGGDVYGSGTVVINFDSPPPRGTSRMSVLILPNVYLAERLSDSEGKWFQPNRNQERQMEMRIRRAVEQAMQRTCRVGRTSDIYFCVK